MKYYLFAVSIWITGIVLGYNLKIEVNSPIISNFEQMTYDNYSIFLNNIKLTILNLVGAVSFGLYSIISLLYNAILNGILIREIIEMDISLFRYLKYAIFENLAILISSKLGIEFGHLVFLYILNSHSFTHIRWLRVFIEFILIIIIVFIGAVLEV